MRKIFTGLVVIMAVLIMAIPVLAECNGDGGPLKAADLEATTYGQIDTHAFHSVRGVTIVNMSEIILPPHILEEGIYNEVSYNYVFSKKKYICSHINIINMF